MNTLQKALFLLCGMVMLAGALALPARSSHRASSRIAWPQLVEWNQVPLTAIKKWSPLEPSIRFFKRSDPSLLGYNNANELEEYPEM